MQLLLHAIKQFNIARRFESFIFSRSN